MTASGDVARGEIDLLPGAACLPGAISPPRATPKQTRSIGIGPDHTPSNSGAPHCFGRSNRSPSFLLGRFQNRYTPSADLLSEVARQSQRRQHVWWLPMHSISRPPMQALLDMQKLLAEELQHRVRNNLQMVSGMLAGSRGPHQTM